MKILVLTNLYPSPLQPHRAPYNRHQLRILGQQHAVRVIAPVLWTDEWAAWRRGLPPLPRGRRVVNDGLVVDHPRYWYTPKLLRRHYGRFFMASVWRTFHAVVQECRPDLVFAPWAYPDGYAAVKLARRAGLPVVVQVHGSDLRELDRYPARTSGTALAVAQADGVVAVSRELADRVIAMGADPSRVNVIIDGVDRQTFCPGPQAAAQKRLGLSAPHRHLLFVGNLVPVKGLDILLDACQRLPGSVGPWQLHLVGDGPLRKSLVARSRALGLSDRVHFHGTIPHAQLPDWFRAADLLVLASRSEGVPNVLLEAAACGLPFVATSVGGIPEIADLGQSRLVPPENSSELAAAMAQTLSAGRMATCSPGPRDRRAAVAELAACLARHLRRHPGIDDEIADRACAATADVAH